ncbi:MAG: carbohydrate ABC transporter substrate-binding protein [Actinobacteria bacterium]|nr:carbohydrate ABC transporter substrate-binding protein [Actinomycetota bacterium]
MRFKIIGMLLVVLLLGAACSSDKDTTDEGTGGDDTAANTGTVSVFNAMEPEEGEALQGIIDELINADSDYVATIETSGAFEEQAKIRIEGGNPPDVMMYPQPGAVIELARSGDAVALEDLGMDVAQMEEQFGEYFMSLGEFEGKHYGVPTNINLKSMVWYPKDDFDAAGYEVPATWEELLALSDQILADGSTPWCVGYESDTATGWPATDWMEDIVLRTAGVDVYDKWVTHEIPFNDPAIVAAGETFGDLMFADGYVLGGADQTPAINFGDAPGPMFDDPPKCWLHRQANFINAFFPKDAEAGTDYDWFPLPPIDQEGTLFAGELSVIFRNAPEVKDFIEQFAGEEVQCEGGATTASSRISPNIDVGPDCYANDILSGASAVLTDSLANDTGRFDASDLMPSAVGAGSFWTGMVKYMQEGPDSLQGVLDEIEASWPAE